MPEPPGVIGTVAIIEPGLIGGSFGLALRKAGFTGSILGVGRPPYIERAREAGAIGEICTLAEAAAAADLLFLSGTVANILETIEHLAPLVRTGCFITDVGSTKARIVETANKFLAPGTFVGGHPMAGKEKRGAENADAELFRDRPYVLTGGSTSPVFASFRQWLQRMGAQILDMDPAQHDVTVAFSSHLPQLLSTALAYTLAGQSDLPLASVYGSGLIDMTRLALSSAALWESILVSNQQQVESALDHYIQMLQHIRETLSTRELSDVFEVASSYAYLLRKQSQ